MGVAMFIYIPNSLIIVLSANKDISANKDKLSQNYFANITQPPITLQPQKSEKHLYHIILLILII